MSSPKKVLVISHDKVGTKMAGPGMRYHHIATQLSKHFEVTLATFNPSYLEGLKDTSYSFKDIKTYDFQADFDKVDVIFALWLSDEMIAYAKSKNKILIFDLYAPVPVEDLIARVFDHRTTAESNYDYAVSLKNYRNFFRNGDYFVCSNPIQKDFWTGYAFASEAVLPSNYNDFPLYDRIGLLPMGTDLGELKTVSKVNPHPKRFKEISPDDFVIVWTGGIWDWFDATTPIQAVKQLVDQGYTKVKLVFLATRHPNKDVPEMSETARAYSLAKKLGLFNKNVFFLEGWLDYTERIDYFYYASAALYAHKPSIEAQYSHRTRVLDHILLAMPTVATAGDYLGNLLSERDYGLTVPPQDVTAMANAIKTLVDDPVVYKRIKQNIKAGRAEFSWENTTKSVIEFIKSAHIGRQPTTPPPMLPANPGHPLNRVKRFVPKPAKRVIKKLVTIRKS